MNPFSEQPVTISHEGETLFADVHAGGAEGVVLLPGWSGTRYGPQRILRGAAAALAARGLTTLRLDFRGRGDATGDPGAVTLDGMISDAVRAAAWLRAERGVGRVSFAGLCSGGNVALGAASLLDDVGHVVCWSLLPFMEHKTQAAKQGTPRAAMLKGLLKKAFNPDAWRKLLHGEANVKGAVQMVVKDKEGDDAEKRRKTSARDILAALERYPGRLHLLYGSRDPEAAGSEAFFTAWARRHGIPVDVRTIAGAPHNYYTAAWSADVAAQTAAWIAGE
jgi:dienelactone hydrolase